MSEADRAWHRLYCVEGVAAGHHATIYLADPKVDGGESCQVDGDRARCSSWRLAHEAGEGRGGRVELS